MTFLNSIVYGKEPADYAGFLLTCYNSEEIYTRPYLKYVERDRLQKGEIKDSMGWMVDPNGQISADTDKRSFMNLDTVQELLQSSGGNNEAYLKDDLISVIRYGLSVGGYVLPKYNNVTREGLEIKIPLRRFRVSASSFNVYAPYEEVEGKGFKTYNLLDPRNGAPVINFFAFPDQELPIKLFGLLSDTGTTFSMGTPENPTADKFRVYECTEGLYEYNPVLGDPFCNFLAFYTGYFKVGLEVARKIAPDSKAFTSDKVQNPVKKTNSVNLAIVHAYSKCMYEPLMDALKDGSTPSNVLSSIPEMMPTYEWVQQILSNDAVVASGNSKDALNTVCFNVKSDCLLNGLCFGLELLSQRYTLFNLGWLLDTTGIVLKGGGVYGTSRKTRKDS